MQVSTRLGQFISAAIIAGSAASMGCVHANGARIAQERPAPAVERTRVSVAETTSAAVPAPVVVGAPSVAVAAEDDDDFDEMPFIRPPSFDDFAALGGIERVRRVARMLEWIAVHGNDAATQASAHSN